MAFTFITLLASQQVWVRPATVRKTIPDMFQFRFFFLFKLHRMIRFAVSCRPQFLPLFCYLVLLYSSLLDPSPCLKCNTPSPSLFNYNYTANLSSILPCCHLLVSSYPIKIVFLLPVQVSFRYHP